VLLVGCLTSRGIYFMHIKDNLFSYAGVYITHFCSVVPITTDVVSSNLDQDEVYNIM
jgi:hypothetical protein